ncbi:MAG: TIR domain-containing protein [Alphaproteobacteria bacterium]
MADIFVSYARADRALIAPLVAALEAQGLSVWWDPEIKAGQEFDQLISAEMEVAKAVIAVWTPASVDSRWVRGEAREAADRRILIPVRFGNARLPLDVRSLHTIDLDDWREDAASAPFQELVRALTALTGSPETTRAQSPASSGAPRVRMTTIVSLDVAGYSKRTESDEANSARQIMALRNRLNAIAGRHGGRIFNTAGDSIMLEFSAAKEAVAAIFELLDDRPLSEPETRAGAHLGDVTVASSGDLLGHGVNVAARLMAQATPGRALISCALKDALDHQVDRPMRDVGELTLPKMETRIHAFEIVPSGAGPARAESTKPRLKGWQVAGIGVAVLAIGVLGFILTRPTLMGRAVKSPASVSALSDSSAGPAVKSASLVPAKPRIAILPFENLSPDPNNAFFTDGMHEEILTALANAAPGLDVISRTTMDSYKGKPVTVEQLAKDLGCTHVLEGSVRREGNEVRLTLQLINARDDSHIWAQDYDRTLTSVMRLQSEVASQVASQLSLKLAGGASIAAPNTADPLAYDLYLKARVALQDFSAFSSLDDIHHTIGLYDQALQIDPSIVRAYVDRIYVRSDAFLFGLNTGDESMNAARQDLATLRKLAPDDPQTDYAAGLIEEAEIEYTKALHSFEAAEAKGWSDPFLLGSKALLLFQMGRYEDSEKISRQLVALDPVNGTRQYSWWISLMELWRPQEALNVADLAFVRWKNDPQFGPFWRVQRASTLFMFGGDLRQLDRMFKILIAAPAGRAPGLANYLEYQNRLIEGRTFIDATHQDVMPANLYWPVLRWKESPVADLRGWSDMFLGDRAEAKRDGQRVLDFLARTPEAKWDRWIRAQLSADAALFMGDNDEAVRKIEQAVALTNATEDKSDQLNAHAWQAIILAWAGR